MTKEQENAINELQRMKMDKSHTGSEYNAIKTAIQAIKDLDTYREPYNKGYEDGVMATSKDAKIYVDDALEEIIAGLKAHKWNKDEGSKAIYDSAINDAIAYVEEYMNRDAMMQATEFLAEARACAESGGTE